jgi:hypothetical protein
MSWIVKTEGPLPMPSEDIAVVQVIDKKTKFLIGKKLKQVRPIVCMYYTFYAKQQQLFLYIQRVYAF